MKLAIKRAREVAEAWCAAAASCRHVGRGRGRIVERIQDDDAGAPSVYAGEDDGRQGLTKIVIVQTPSEALKLKTFVGKAGHRPKQSHEAL